MILHQLCCNDHISEIIVVEKEPEIIDMIAPAFPESKVTILQGDAFLPDECGITGQFDTMFFDIWNNITSQTYSEMQELSVLWMNWQSPQIQILHRKEKLTIEAQKRQKLVYSCFPGDIKFLSQMFQITIRFKNNMRSNRSKH